MSNEADQQSLLSTAAQYGIEVARERLAGKTLAVLTGAGISTDSGIPDYRGAGRLPRHPMTYDAFIASNTARARYWSRSMVGIRTIASATPNAGHFALASAEITGSVAHLITQNVDGLHQLAGSRRVIELHGSLGQVRCLRCQRRFTRQLMNDWLRRDNPNFDDGQTFTEANPDGDAEVETPEVFVVPNCPECGGTLKPDVVFFGESVPVERVSESFAAIEKADALVVAGTSLAVNSGLRFVRMAAKNSKPIVIVNLGPTKADELASVKIEANTSVALERLLND